MSGRWLQQRSVPEHRCLQYTRAVRIPSSIRVALTTVLATTAIALGTTPRPQAQDGRVPEAWLLPPRDGGEMLRCATGEDRVRELRVRPLAAVPDGRVGSFVQDPPILSADFDGRLVLRDFVVLGDVPTARFVPWVDPSIDVPEPEVWTRSETRRIGGRLVSVFTPSWSGDGISKFMRSKRWDGTMAASTGESSCRETPPRAPAPPSRCASRRAPCRASRWRG